MGKKMHRGGFRSIFLAVCFELHHGYRCVICLTWLSATQCAHVLDAATLGERQVHSEAMV